MPHSGTWWDYDDWLLLDSCSTVSCMKNEAFVTSVTQRSRDDSLRVYTNGGHQDYCMTGILQILPLEVYVNPSSMANIVSLKDVYKRYRVTMDTKTNPVCWYTSKTARHIVSGHVAKDSFT